MILQASDNRAAQGRLFQTNRAINVLIEDLLIEGPRIESVDPSYIDALARAALVRGNPRTPFSSKSLIYPTSAAPNTDFNEIEDRRQIPYFLFIT
ncbi:hypothetical protein DU002_10645 [Corallincola holothuriorum]|uniref:Uncharacterized protein n=1 Tax=Corallincola holothuriorum TaxID=2282215 RepID=A0A368NK89_9GAMM|nr:hypothetical protein DU002_10645 [Corallincola holothuriorum]